MPLVPLPSILVEPIVRQALLEDLGRAGDITTDAIAPADRVARTVMAARQDGVVAGLDLAALAFRLIDPAIRFEPVADRRRAGLAGRRRSRSIEGPARGVLTAERTALNFACRLSGIASATARLGGGRRACTRRASSAPARPRRSCARSRNTRCGPAAAPITASASTTRR